MFTFVKKVPKALCLNILAAVASGVAIADPTAAAWITDHGDMICTAALSAVNVASLLLQARAAKAKG